MELTNQVFQAYEKLYAELKVIQEALSDQVQTAKARSADNEIEIEREGKKVKVKESTLWQEVYYLGADCPAGIVLKEKYPEVWKLKASDAEKVKEIMEFEVKNFGFSHKQMSMPNCISLIKGLIEWEIKKGV